MLLFFHVFLPWTLETVFLPQLQQRGRFGGWSKKKPGVIAGDLGKGARRFS
jgi:hypothetical protein